MDFELFIGLYIFLLVGLFYLITGLYGIYYKNLHLQGSGRVWNIYVIRIKDGVYSKKLNRGVGAAILFVIFGLMWSTIMSAIILTNTSYWPKHIPVIFACILLAKYFVNRHSNSILLNKQRYKKAKAYKHKSPMLIQQIEEYEKKSKL